MPNVFDQYDTDTKNPFDEFDEDPSLSPQSLAQENLLKAQRPYFGTGQQPFDPMTGSFLGPVSEEEKRQFVTQLMMDPMAGLETIVGASENALSLPIGYVQRHLKTVGVPELDTSRADINKPQPEEAQPPTGPIKYVTPAQAGVTPETPMMEMPPESQKGIEPAIARFVSPMTSSVGVAQLPAFEFAPVRALYAGEAVSALPGAVKRLVTAKNPSEFKDAATTAGLDIFAAAALVRSLKTKGVPNAPQERSIKEGVPTERPGDGARGAPAEAGTGGGVPTTEAVAKAAQVPLKEEHQAYLDSERQGMDVSVDVTDKTPEGNAPFAGQVATIDRDNGRILINAPEFTKWLDGVRPDRRAQAVKSLLSEERIHLLTDDDSALSYWNSLTAAEKLINQRRYTGSWVAKEGAKGGLDDIHFGHEALRFRMQQLSRMTPREIAEASGRERWTVQGLTSVESAIRTLREKLGTKASGTQTAILDRMMGNLATARFVASGGAQPSAMLKQYEEDTGKKFRPQDYGDNDIKFTVMKFPDMPQIKGSVQADSVKGGLNEWSTNPNDLRNNGFKVPSSEEMLAKLPPGQYTLGQVREMIGREAAPLNVPTEAPKTHVTAEDYKRFGIPDLKQGMVRLYNGTFLGSGAGGTWWTDNPYRAGSFGDKVQYVDVTIDQARSFKSAAEQKGQGGSSHFITDDKVLKSGKPVPRPPMQKVHEIDMPEGGTTPSAIRKKQIKQSGQEELFLPPIHPSEVPSLERGGYKAPSGTEMEADATAYLKSFREGAEKIRRPPQAPGPPKTAKQQREGVPLPRVEPKEVVPSFEEFKGALESKHGAIGKEKLFYLWQDSITKLLMEATGSELSDMIVALGLKRDVGEALKPSSRDPYVGKIPDIMTKEEMDNQIEYVRKMFSKKPWMSVEEFKRKFGPDIARKFSEPFQRRYAAIGAILDEMNQRAGGKPTAPWDRKEIGPEDIAQGYTVAQAVPKSEEAKVQGGEELSVKPEVDSQPLVRSIPIDSMKDPKAVGDMVTAGAAVEASGKGAPPRTVSRNVVAMRGPNGNIVLVSAWRDPRKGPKVTDPTAPTLPGKSINTAMLSQWEPLMVMTLREPVQKFFRSFKDQNEFDRWFGDVGIEGTTGLRTSSVVGPIADIYRAQTEAARTRAPRPEEALPPPAKEVVSPTAQELQMPEGARPAAVPGRALYHGPTVPPVPEKFLSKADQKFVEQQSKEEFPPLPSLYEEIAKVHQFKPTGAGKAFVTSRPQFVIKGKGGLILGPRTRTEPLALNKQRATDETTQLFKALRAMVARRDTKQHLPRILDGMERAGDQYARAAGEAIRLKSFGKAGQSEIAAFDPETPRRQKLKDATHRREAAKAMIASTGRKSTSENPIAPGEFTPNGLDFLMKDVQSGIAKAELWQVSRDPIERLWANRWLKAANRLKGEIDYARENWDDPQLQATAAQILKEGKAEIEWENKNGFDVTERQHYIPGRYEGEFWNDRQVSFSPLVGSGHFLGEQFRGGKTFKDYYEAIRHGPYIPASYDPALIMESRIRSGRYRGAQVQAFELYKEIKDPETKKPIAVDPRMVPKVDEEGKTHFEYFPPTPEHHLVYPHENRRGVPLAVTDPYYPAVRSLTRTSQIADLPLGKEALIAASILKHGWLMIGDVFHGSRLGQYAVTLSGKNLLDFNAGHKGGYAVLNWRPEDLPEAVQKGFITQKAADWATETIPVKMRDGTTRDVSRHQIGSELLRQGLNASRIMDALYKDAVRRIPLIGEPWHKVIGPYNRWLFDKFSSGLMLQQAVINFERLHEKFPNMRIDRIGRDVVRQINIEFGNMGRQGIFKNPTFRDFAQIFLLAPLWREGIIAKELSTYANLAKAAGYAAKGDLTEARYRMSQPVLRSMMRGLAGYFVMTQALNLITRKQFTWKNEEKDHKFDAYIPTSKDSGFWLSPMSVFMEMTHDTIRLLGSKPRAHDALLQIGANALGPVGKAAHVIATGEDDFGRRIGSTANILGTAAGELAPMPLSFGAPARALGHKLAPSLINPPAPGAMQRQMMGWGGLKVQPSESTLTQVSRMAAKYAKEKDLKPESGFYLQPTDEPSYAALRSAIRNDNRNEAKRVFDALRKTHKLKHDAKGNVVDDPILKAMGIWARRPLTGSYDGETQFVNSLSDQELDMYSRAEDERMKMLNQYIDWYIQNSGE